MSQEIHSNTGKSFQIDELQRLLESAAPLESALEIFEGTPGESEGWISAILEQLPVAVGVVDLNGRYLLNNKVMRRIVGHKIPSQDIQQKRRWRVFDSEGHPLPPTEWPGAQALRGTTVQPGMDCLYTDEEGNDYWMEVSTAPLRNRDGEIFGALTVAQDITERKQMETRLRESAERFRALMEASSDVVFRMSPDWCEMCQLLGRGFIADTQEPSRKWLLKYIPPEDQPQVMAAINKAIRTRSAFELEHRVLRQDGTLGWTFSRAIPRLNEKGEIVEWLGMAKDVTDRRQAEEEVQQACDHLQAVLDSVPAGVVVADPAGEIVLASPETERIFGGPVTGDAHGPDSGYRLLLPNGAPIPEGELPLSQALAGRTVTEMEILVTRGDGSRTFILASARSLKSAAGEPVGAVTVFQDISALKEVEENLSHARAAADDASSAKSDFLANMSHEIRTPMTVFMAAIEHLLHIDHHPERRNLLKMADQSAKRLHNLINDILDFSRIEARRIDLQEEPFQLRSCVESVVGMFSLAAREKGVRLEWKVAPEAPEIVVGDPDRLGQILINLIGNAVKFTQDGEVRVSVRPRGSSVEFSVADTGIGIPAEKRKMLFESFTQADSSITRKYGGTGLGLAISKGLVELMGGQIEVRDGTEKGTVFTFALPLKTAGEQISNDAGISREDSGAGTGARVLLAEDDPMIRDVLTLMLAKRDCLVETAETGRAALQKWESGTYDLVLMDVQMPEVNGLEVTRAIRKQESGDTRRACIVGLTAHVQRKILDECLEAGMDRVLTKPVQATELYTAIENCLST